MQKKFFLDILKIVRKSGFDPIVAYFRTIIKTNSVFDWVEVKVKAELGKIKEFFSKIR